MKNRFSEVKNLVDSLESDFQKFYDKNNKAAGTRIRKGMQDLKNMAQEIRMKVQDEKNSMAAPASASPSAGKKKK
jgi:hypothetical protein